MSLSKRRDMNSEISAKETNAQTQRTQANKQLVETLRPQKNGCTVIRDP